MKLNVILIATFLLLSACASTSNNTARKSSVEAEAILYITTKTVESMENCIKYKDLEACETADGKIKKYPWLRTRQVRVTNQGGMRQNEWEIALTSIRKHLDYVRDNYEMFHLEVENLQ